MAPHLHRLFARDFHPGVSSQEFLDQWKNPSDVFSVLLLLGGDVVARALAQLAGSKVTPVAFSFGWVAYAVTAVVSAVGENKLMPLSDCACVVINGRTGYVRDNSSWIIGRIVRDYEYWMDKGQRSRPVFTRLEEIINERWEFERLRTEKDQPGAGVHVERPARAGLCVSIYRAEGAVKGFPGNDWLYYLGFTTSILQLGIAAIPCGIWGEWATLLITAAGILLSLATGSLSQWKTEKWCCREKSEKTVILTKGNGAQHAIVIIGDDKAGLDLEDLATSSVTADSTSLVTRVIVIGLATLWISLLITAASLHHHTWFLLAVGGIGIVHNIIVAGAPRSPKDFGLPLRFEQVIAKPKVMDALFDVETAYPHVGRSMRETFFPGELRPQEETRWQELQEIAKEADRLKKANKATRGV